MSDNSEAARVMAESIRQSLSLTEAATKDRIPGTLQAGRSFLRNAILEIEQDDGWLPDKHVLDVVGPAGIEEAARIVAAGVIDDYRTTGSLWQYQLRLVRHLVLGGATGPVAMLASALRYRADSVSPNLIEPDPVLIALGAPEETRSDAAAEALAMLDSACRVAALDVDHIATHAGDDSDAIAAITRAAGALLGISDEAGDARSFALTGKATSAPRSAFDQHRRRYWREQMVEIGRIICDATGPESSGASELVRAFSRHLITGEDHVPDIRADDEHTLFELTVTATERYCESLDCDSDWLVPNWLMMHLTTLATSRLERIPGAMVATPFVDAHALNLGRWLEALPRTAHAAGQEAFESGTTFAVAGLHGLAARANDDVRDAVMFAARPRCTTRIDGPSGIDGAPKRRVTGGIPPARDAGSTSNRSGTSL